MHLITSLALGVFPWLFVLGLIISVHELGHFLVAKWLGIAIDRFSLGFGRALFRWRDRSGVEWRIGWIPLGGYVRFAGDSEASSTLPDADSLAQLRRDIQAREGVGAERKYYHFKPVWARALVAAAGPAANFLLAIALFAVLLSAVGEVIVKPRIGLVQPGTPAAQAGFQPGDVVTAVDGRAIDDFSELQRHISLRAGQPIHFVVQRGAGTLDLTATPVRRARPNLLTGKPMNVGTLGVTSSGRPEDVFRRRYNPIQAVYVGVGHAWDILDTTVFYIGRLVRGLESGDQLGGPLRTAQISSAVATAAVHDGTGLGQKVEGVVFSLLNLAAILSVGIGFMNLLPVPVLDGGHLLFYAYEAVARRPLGARIQAAGYRVGLALLLALMLFATWNDLQQLSVFKIVRGFFVS